MVKTICWCSKQCPSIRMGSWAWTWHGCWCQMGWSEYFRSSWSAVSDFHIQQSQGITENGLKKRKCPVSSIYFWQKCLVDARGQRWMARLGWADRKTTVTQIINYAEEHIWMQKYVSDYVHPLMTTVYPSRDGYFQQDNAPCTPSHLKLVSWTSQ